MMPLPDAAATRAEVDAHARAAQGGRGCAAVGQLRAAVLHDLVIRSWAGPARRSAPTWTWWPPWTRWSPPRPGPRAGREPVLVNGEPVTAAAARELLERVDALCPGGLQAPTDGTLMLSVTDADGRLLVSVTRRELESPSGTGAGCARRRRWTGTAEPGAAAVGPHPGSHLPACRLRQSGRLGRPRPRRRARRGRGDRLRQPVLPVSAAPPVEDPCPRVALRDDAGRRPDHHHAQRRHPRQPTAGHGRDGTTSCCG